jgi:hypothetical protein
MKVGMHKLVPLQDKGWEQDPKIRLYLMRIISFTPPRFSATAMIGMAIVALA